jgi:UDP-N-acetylmuramoyl-tripeptide--D-alanyl-D-alanine ligase
MALAAGVDLDTVADALGDAESASRWRMEVRERADGAVVVNDAYNANPESMEAALESLQVIGEQSGRRTVAVLGEMLELGADAAQAHRRVGAYARAAGIDVLVTVGPPAVGLAEGFGGEAIVTAGRDEALLWLRENVSAGDVVLVKASRGAALEVVVEGLLAPDPGGTEGSNA